MPSAFCTFDQSIVGQFLVFGIIAAGVFFQFMKIDGSIYV